MRKIGNEEEKRRGENRKRNRKTVTDGSEKKNREGETKGSDK